jgi:hypothetical protein
MGDLQPLVLRERGIPRKRHTAGGKGGRFQRPEPALCGSVASGDEITETTTPIRSAYAASVV